MKRREFITLLGGAAVAWPFAARAQQRAKVPRVGILSPAASETAATLGIMDALPALVAELVRIPVNVIVTDSTSGTLDAFAVTRTIPIVMGASGGDPVALGLAKSLSRPGGNVTGTYFLSGLSDKRSQLLKQAFPGAQRVAVLANPAGAISVSEMPKAEIAASRIGLRLVSLSASTPAELRALAPAALSVGRHVRSWRKLTPHPPAGRRPKLARPPAAAVGSQ
jgi:putative ABC transport system substrate-binding protein